MSWNPRSPLLFSPSTYACCASRSDARSIFLEAASVRFAVLFLTFITLDFLGPYLGLRLGLFFSACPRRPKQQVGGSAKGPNHNFTNAAFIFAVDSVNARVTIAGDIPNARATTDGCNPSTNRIVNICCCRQVSRVRHCCMTPRSRFRSTPNKKRSVCSSASGTPIGRQSFCGGFSASWSSTWWQTWAIARHRR